MDKLGGKAEITRIFVVEGCTFALGAYSARLGTYRQNSEHIHHHKTKPIYIKEPS